MKKIGIFCLGCLLDLFLISSSGDKTNIVRKPDVKSHEFLIGQQRQSPKPDNRISQMKVSPDFGMLPLYFIPNQGQVEQAARFYARTSRYTLWITRQGLVFDSIRKDAGAIRATGVSRLVFVNANPNLEIVPLEDDGYRINYFTGNDPGKWHTAIPTARAVLYRGIYKNIDLKVHGIEKQVEYDWLVRPGGDVASIKFECQSIESAHVDAEGNLLVETPFGVLKHKKPFAFQNTAKGSRKTANAAFKRMAGNIWGFTVGEYDRSLELVIDPLILVYSTYLGGSADEYDYGIAVDGAGCAYVTGQTASSDFPISDTPFQPSKSIGWDLFVTKLNSSGSGLVYSTYLGGSANDYGLGIAVDSSGCAYLTGYTASVNFPIYNPMQMFYGGGNTDAFVAKLNAGGDTLLYSTFLGGQGDERGLSIALDGTNCAYVTGYTNSVNFPVSSNPFQQTKSVGWDAFVTKLNASGNGLDYSTYLGGWSDDSGSGIAVDSSGCAYVTGQTASSNFPTQNPYQSYRAGGSDAFVSKLNASGSGLVYSTFLGGSADDYGFGIALDGSGCAYVTGQTAANDFPTHNSFQSANMGGRDAFVSKLTSGGNGLVYSTYLGGSADDGGNGIAVNSTGCAFVTGQTASGNFPTNNSFQSTQGGGFDAFVSELNASGNSLVFSTYLGGSSDDHGFGIALDGTGYDYLTGYTQSPDFPIGTNPFQADKNGGWDAFISKLALTHTVSFIAGANGHLTGNANQTIVDGYNTSAVTAVPNSGYHFVNWTGTGGFTSTANPLTVTNVISNMTITANFAITPNYTVNFLAGVNGTLSGNTTQTVSQGGSTTPVTALPDSGYHFVNWTGTGGFTSTANPLAVTNVTANMSITANFAITITYTVNFLAGSNGTLSGTTTQTVSQGGSTTPVTALPDSGYHFVNWTGTGGFTSTANPLTVTNVISNMTITANFAVTQTYTVNFLAGTNGTLSGNTTQTVSQGGSTTPVTAVPNSGFCFFNWTGTGGFASTANPLTVTNVISNMTITANFVIAPTLLLQGQRLLERVWLVRRPYGQINVTVSNPGNASVVKYILYRKVSGGTYSVIREIAPSSFKNGQYTFNDLFANFFNQTMTYTYKLEARNAAGILLATSNEVTI